jgi:hypothetical protein
MDVHSTPIMHRSDEESDSRSYEAADYSLRLEMLPTSDGWDVVAFEGD